MRRRTLLQGIGVATAASLVPAVAWAAAPKKKGVLLGGTKGTDAKTGQLVHGLSLIDLDAPDARAYVSLDFLIHGCAIDPKNRNRALLFEKRGPHGVEVDLGKAARLRSLAPREGHAFYGHAAFSRDGASLFVVESDLANGHGSISVLDAQTLAPLGVLETHGLRPHDIVLARNGKQAFITNGGGDYPDGPAGCVTLVELASGKLVEKREIPEARFNAGHVGVSAAGDLVVVSAPRDGLAKTELGGLSLGAPGGALSTMRSPAPLMQSLRGETLSIAIDDARRRAVVTTPDGNLLTAWNLASQQFIKSFDLPLARGVAQTLDGEHFVVCHGTTATASFISTKTLELEPRLQLEKTLIAGSHIVMWDGVVG